MSGLRWRVLSTAGIARVVSAANPGRFRAVGGRDPARTQVLAAETGIERTFDGCAAMLARDEIDAVYIPLPNALHTEWTIAARKVGKTSCARSRSLRRRPTRPAASTSPRPATGLAEGFMWRLHPQTRLAQQLIADGARPAGHGPGGPPHRHHRPERHPPLPGPGRRSTRRPGLLLRERDPSLRRQPHPPDRRSRLRRAAQCGRLRWLRQRMGGVLRGANGTIGVFDCALDLPRADELEVIGSEGMLRVPDPWLCGFGELLLTRKGVTEWVRVDPDGHDDLIGHGQDAYRIEIDVFPEAVAGERPHPFGRADAVAEAATLEAIRRSAQTGRAVTL